MAVGSPHIYPTFAPNQVANYPTTPTSLRTKAAASAMSHHYPAQPPDSSETGMLPVGYTLSYSMPPPQEPQPTPTSLTSQLHVDNPQQPYMSMQRSISTPEPRQLFQASSEQLQAGSAGEKKRNKLGYHRTSVACSHCRRRKIRCIPSPSDTQGRCINCIRLKKECSFIPADQQQPSASRVKASASTLGDHGRESTPSSSRQASTDRGEAPMHPESGKEAMSGSSRASPKQQLAMTKPQASADLPSSGRQYGFGDQNVTSWLNSNADTQANRQGGHSDDAWQTQSPTTTNASFSPYGQVTTFPGLWSPQETSQASQGEQGQWDSMSPPARSGSYSGRAGDPAAAQAGYAQFAQSGPYHRSPFPETYPPSMGMSVRGIPGSSAMMMNASSSLPAGQGSSQHSMVWQQQEQHQPQQQQFRQAPGPGYGGWMYEQQMAGQQLQLDGSGNPVTTGDGPPTPYYTSQ